MEVVLHDRHLGPIIENALPGEILTLIFQFLDIKSRMGTELVCRRWNEFSKNPNSWSTLKHFHFKSCVYKPGKLFAILSRAGQYIKCLTIELNEGVGGFKDLLLLDLSSLYGDSRSERSISFFLPNLAIFNLDFGSYTTHAPLYYKLVGDISNFRCAFLACMNGLCQLDQLTINLNLQLPRNHTIFDDIADKAWLSRLKRLQISTEDDFVVELLDYTPNLHSLAVASCFYETGSNRLCERLSCLSKLRDLAINNSALNGDQLSSKVLVACPNLECFLLSLKHPECYCSFVNVLVS